MLSSSDARMWRSGIWCIEYLLSYYSRRVPPSGTYSIVCNAYCTLESDYALGSRLIHVFIWSNCFYARDVLARLVVELVYCLSDAVPSNCEKLSYLKRTILVPATFSFVCQVPRTWYISISAAASQYISFELTLASNFAMTADRWCNHTNRYCYAIKQSTR